MLLDLKQKNNDPLIASDFTEKFLSLDLMQKKAALKFLDYIKTKSSLKSETISHSFDEIDDFLFEKQ